MPLRTSPLFKPKQAVTRATGPLIPAVSRIAKARQAVAIRVHVARVAAKRGVTIRVQVARAVAIRAATELTAVVGTVLRKRAAATTRAERELVVRVEYAVVAHAAC